MKQAQPYLMPAELVPAMVESFLVAVKMFQAELSFLSGYL